MKCPVCGVNIPRYILAVLAAFITVFVFDWLWHGILMMDMYNETAALWRSEAEMSDYFLFMLLMQFVLAKWLVFIYTRNVEGKGWTEGLRYGALMGGLGAIFGAQTYAFMPLPVAIPAYWAVGYMIQFILVGLVAALIYKPCAKACSES